MTTPAFLPAAIAAALLAGCSTVSMPADSMSTETATALTGIYASEQGRDVHSAARPLEARVEHVSLDLTPDFTRKIIRGVATLDLWVADDATSVMLDTKGLDIESVRDAEGRALDWSYGAADEFLGQPLKVELDGAKRVVIAYQSRPDAAALQWLSPEQTAGGETPFLFSQGQAILNRTWIPTQDSPGIRQSWDATVHVPAGMTAVMSGTRVGGDSGAAAGAGTRVRYEQKNPVPPYLIAIGIGDLEFRELGKRTGVWAEPATVDLAANELVDVEKMVAAAEALYGPYRWGRYDMLVLPPSFPFGGMENPQLTFLTPTILAGDRSLVSLVAHELAHSWSGNLVTNATWDDFWLNEGFTVYFENRIMEALYGEERADMLATLGYQDLQEDIESLGGMGSADTQLHLALAGRDPDDGMTNVAYEKGALFLHTLEEAVGRERFDAWLRGYFDRNAFQPQTSAGMLADMRANLFDGKQPTIDLDRWVYQPGIPDGAALPQSGRFEAVNAEIAAFARDGNAAALSWPDWTTQERQHFLNNLPRELPAARLAALDEAFGLDKAGNSEILFAWLRLAIANRYDPAKPAVARFLGTQGRRKFVLPLFEDLMAQGEWGQPFARDLYARVRPGYHSVTANSVDAVVK